MKMQNQDTTLRGNELGCYALTTWSGDNLSGYEPLIAKSIAEATAFAQGMLTERIRNHEEILAGRNVRYVVEHGHRELQEVTSDHVADAIGSWSINSARDGLPLLWTSSNGAVLGA